MEPRDTVEPERLREHVAGVRRLARHLVRDPATAEDVAQETLLLALQRVPSKVRDLGAWLRGVVRFKALQSRRADARRRRHERAVPTEVADRSPVAVVARMEAHEHLLAALRALPADHRLVVWLRYFEDLPASEIAARLAQPVETVRTRLKRAVDRLRADLDARHGGDRSRWRGALLLLAGRERGPSPWIATGGGLMAASVPVKAGALALLAAAALGLWLLREGPGDSRPSASDDDAERVAKVARTAEAPRLEAGPPARSSDAAASGRRLRVLDPDRRPLPGASVYRVPPGAIYVSSADRWAAETDAEGVVRVPASALSSGGLLLARRAGFVPGTLDPRAWAEGPEAEIVLGRGETVSGVVVDPWGAPLPDVEVHAHRGALFNAPFATEDLWPGIDAASRHQTTRSDAQGRFVLTGIARFPVQLTARKPHWVCVIRREHDVRESRDDVRLVLHPIGRLGVRALDAVSRLPLRTFDARSADERFLFPGPPAVRPNECWLTCPVNAEMGPGRPGTMSVVVAAWGYRRKTVDLALRYPEDEAFEEPQEVFLDPLPTRDALGRVTLRAAYPALGRAPDKVRVALHSDRLDLAPLGSAENPMGSKARASQLVFLEQGQTTVDLPAGVYEIALEGPGVGPRPPEWRAFEVNRGETTTVDLTVPGSIVHVRAYGPGRIPVPFFHVQATAKASMTMRWHGLLLDPEPWIEDEARMYGAERGRISLGLGASTEPLRIGVAADGFQSWSQPLLVEEGKSYEIEALLEPEAESR